MIKKENYKSIVIVILFLGGIISYFLFDHISMHALGLFLFISIGFYFFDIITSLDFEKEHYVFVVIISLSVLFFYYMQLHFLYIDKVLHFTGGIMLCSVMHHFVRRKKLENPSCFLLCILFSLFVILGYELYEYLSDAIFNTQMQGVYFDGIVLIGAVTDTVQDIFLGMGGVMTSLFLYFYFCR